MRPLHRALGFIDRHPRSRKIFVVGTGRSGTHWLGHILDAHPRIAATIEEKGVFDRVVKLAIDPDGEAAEWEPLVRAYRYHHSRAVPRHYVDKSHPALWMIDELLDVFPRSKFVAIQRNAYATVNSMLQHEGVRRWCEDGQWEQTPRPNRFLGLDVDNEDWYRTAPVAARCARRWQVHAAELDRQARVHPDELLVIQYEDLFEHQPRELDRLTAFLDISLDFEPPVPNARSAERWRTEMSAEAVAAVEAVVGVSPPTPVD